MKSKATLATLALLGAATSALAAADHNYDAVGMKVRTFDVYNDGKNTYIEAVRGLSVPGSKRENDSFVVEGMPPEIKAQYAGKSLVIKWRRPVEYARVVEDRNTSEETASTGYALSSPAADPAQQAGHGTSLQQAADTRQKLKDELRLELQALEANKTAMAAPAQQQAATLQPFPVPTASLQVNVAATIDPKVNKPSATGVYSLQVNGLDLPSTDSATPPKTLSVIKRGRLIDDGLLERATAEGWTFSWYSKKHWEAIADIDISRYKTADEAAEDIVNGLREEGKPIQLRISEGNKVMEVFSTEVKND